MISRAHRFHGFRSLTFVYKNGVTARGPQFAVRAVLNPRRDSYRVAVVISKKVHKSAVTRNRMRRRLYETTRLLGPEINEPYDIVLSVFNDQLLDLPAPALKRQLKKQLKDAGALAPKNISPGK